MGTVTLLFTDIEGSTRLVERLGRRYLDLLADHHRLMRAAIAANGGYEVGVPAGDSFFAAFRRPGDAVECAEAMRRALRAHAWADGAEVRVRMGLHAGTPEWDGSSFQGMDVHRAARIMAAAHGGQILASAGTAALLDGVVLLELGEHRLKDIRAPERLVQVGAGEFPPPRSMGLARLPAPPTALVGREADVRDCVTAIRDGTRLFTLTGAGGAGKTRVALAVASGLSGEFADGAFFVDLAPVARAEGVAAAIAAVVGGGAPQDPLEARLAGRRMLLVLDNLEHLLDAAPLVARLLAGAPEVAVLATSRVALHVRGEVVRPVEPLAPAAAEQLFVARARDSGAAINPDDPAVAELCRLLDGLPLALELAAARARVLGVRGLIDRLARRIDVLGEGPRDAPERQRTLRATVEWSHRLLDRDARVVFGRLAVFAGGTDLEAAEAVCGLDTLEAVETLVDAGMLRRREGASGARLTMLETLRAYALERLEADDDAHEVHDRHAAYFLAVAEHLDAQIHNAARPEIRECLRREINNFRVAHDHLLATQPDAALRLIAGTWVHWETVGPLAEGRRRLRESLERARASGLIRGRALFGAARLAVLHGDADAAEPLAREAVELLRHAGDDRLLALAVSHQAIAAKAHGDLAAAHALDEEALTIAQAFGDEWTIAMALNNLADSIASTEPARAQRLFEESLEHRRRSGDARGAIITTVNLVELALRSGDLDSAEALAAAALRDARQLQDNQMVATLLSELAAISVLQGRAGQAHERLSEAAFAHRQVGEARTGATLLVVAGALAAAQDPAAGARAWGAAETLLERLGVDAEALELHVRRRGEAAAVVALGATRFAAEVEVGRAADAAEALEAALPT
jgi:predicted ATPase